MAGLLEAFLRVEDDVDYGGDGFHGTRWADPAGPAALRSPGPPFEVLRW